MQFVRLVGFSFLGTVMFFTGAMLFTSPQQVWIGTSILHGSAHEEGVYDLAIKDVSLRKITDVKADETQYVASVVLKNQGENMPYNQAVLSIEPTDRMMVLSKPDGNFYLQEGEEFTLEETFTLPEEIAAQELNFKVEALSFADENKQNNSQTVFLQEDVAAIKNLKIENVTEAGQMILSWQAIKNENASIEYSVLVAASDQMLLTDGEYQEVVNSGYLYQVGDFSHKNFNQYDFSQKSISNHSFSLDWNPWDTNQYAVVVLKAENSETKAKFYSDMVYLQPMEQLSRAELARLIVEKLQLEPNENVIHFFDDVPDDEWFATYVKSLYAMGALEDEANFRPNDAATRRDLAKMLSNIFQLPYNNLGSFGDVPSHDSDYYAIGSMKNLVAAWNKRVDFLPEAPVYQATAKYVISALKAQVEID